MEDAAWLSVNWGWRAALVPTLAAVAVCGDAACSPVFKWGRVLIGLSLVSGLMVRVSGVFGILLMLVYWTAHLDFRYVESNVNFLLDYQFVYASLIVYLIVMRAGHVFGLDSYAEKLDLIGQNPFLRPLVN